MRALTEYKSVQLNVNKPQLATGYRCSICRDTWANCLENQKEKIKLLSILKKKSFRTDEDTSASLQ